MVVKDVWLKESRRPEYDLIREILEKKDDEKALNVVRKFLFTVISFDRVKVGNEEDTTRRTILRGLRLRERLRVPTDWHGSVHFCTDRNMWHPTGHGDI